MDVSPLNTASPPAAANAPVNTPVISSDFETFLTMLTAQLKNQDPLNPVEADDYAVQLATFSSVEQQVLTNELLQQLTGMIGGTTMSDYAAWVGMEARAPVLGYFEGDPITISPNPLANADEAELVVYDKVGQEVARRTIEATGEPAAWNGLDASGALVPAGLYRFEIASYQSGVLLGQVPAEVYARVVEVQTGPDGATLILEGGQRVDASAVTGLRTPPTPTEPAMGLRL